MFNGCRHDCSYCFCKKGVLGAVLGGITPIIKKSVGSFDNAVMTAIKEVEAHKEQIIADGGVLFSFSTDPCQEGMVWTSTSLVAKALLERNVPVTILTKAASFVRTMGFSELLKVANGNLLVGFTLTGHDELEPHAAPNALRIDAMRYIHNAGIKTFASIEPIVDFDASLSMIRESRDCCDLFKVGLMSGVKEGYYSNDKLVAFCENVMKVDGGFKVYWKDSIRKRLQKVSPQTLENIDKWEYSVSADYNIFAE